VTDIKDLEKELKSIFNRRDRSDFQDGDEDRIEQIQVQLYYAAKSEMKEHEEK
jgi:hypothetical protein